MFWVTDPEADDPGFFLDPVLLKPASRGSVQLRSSDPTRRTPHHAARAWLNRRMSSDSSRAIGSD